ncbi:chorismate lyase [Vibrio sp. SCSIO 43136]|uniref:chorismate lyase n=1 Tax=Vibrio sp. SCSIO 43136 TaxID=2819101 RepID=UPI0020763D82|nr:chorismate lyase [Vibrio sp. SCSIO 43136]USD65397.1 chorismate lyase [Vibrio sp. SCSIO 43136]
MEELRTLYFTALKDVQWCQPENFDFSCSRSRRWLLEQGSLSRMLAEQCQSLSVDLLTNQNMAASELTAQESHKISDQSCWLREVILKGDDKAWVLGRTLIPESSLIDQQYDLSRQGDIPLGLTVFSAEDVRRDALEVGIANTPNGELLARRSRLWMNNKPMLVAELFLPDAPIYIKEKA